MWLPVLQQPIRKKQQQYLIIPIYDALSFLRNFKSTIGIFIWNAAPSNYEQHLGQGDLQEKSLEDQLRVAVPPEPPVQENHETTWYQCKEIRQVLLSLTSLEGLWQAQYDEEGNLLERLRPWNTSVARHPQIKKVSSSGRRGSTLAASSLLADGIPP